MYLSPYQSINRFISIISDAKVRPPPLITFHFMTTTNLPKESNDVHWSMDGCSILGFEKKLWSSLLHVALWSLWRIRNRFIFENFKPNWELETQQLRIWLGYWAKSWCPKLPFSTEYFARHLDLVRKLPAWSFQYQKESMRWLETRYPWGVSLKLIWSMQHE